MTHLHCLVEYNVTHPDALLLFTSKEEGKERNRDQSYCFAAEIWYFKRLLPTSFDSGEGFYDTCFKKTLNQGSELRLWLEDEAIQLETILPLMAYFPDHPPPGAERTRVK